MQKDFHHAVTYVTARIAGFDHAQAGIIAHSAQYVDDATNSGTIAFDNGALYTRISSAHKMVDARNLNDVTNHRVWMPFHFLPGNGGFASSQHPEGGFVEKLVCRPGSAVACDMVDAAFSDRQAPSGLHRLGIAMHVYADTWAHQGFAGVVHEVNDISLLDDIEAQKKSTGAKAGEALSDLWGRAKSCIFGDALPLGHAAALSCPDLPSLRWKYTDHRGRRVTRNNTDTFTAAADAMCRAMRRYRANDPAAAARGMPEQDLRTISDLFRTLKHDDCEVRHAKWALAVAEGCFSFGPAAISYIAKGVGSWKCMALNTIEESDSGQERFPYTDAFLTSNWKLFHDALQAHRFDVINRILPRYGICAG